MITLLFVICIILIIVGEENLNDAMEWIGIIGAMAFGFTLIGLLAGYPYKIDEKIELYETENQVIEEKVKETVKAYMNYEQETYSNLVENADVTTLLVAYPELNSNELVKSEIETYKENSNKLKEFKEEQLNKPIYKFLLYFGR